MSISQRGPRKRHERFRVIDEYYSGILYTLHLTLYTKKIALQSDFSCTIQNNSLPLQPIR